MTTLTIKNAKDLANQFVTAQGVRDSVTAILNSAYIAHVDGDAKATKYIVAFWGEVAKDKKALATLRALFNRVSKKINKDRGISELACTVKDGKIQEVAPRVKTGNGGGDGETAENGSSVEAIKVDNTAKYKLAMRHLESMLKAEKDEKRAEALDVALNLLASQVA
jgi:hypothetical protein